MCHQRKSIIDFVVIVSETLETFTLNYFSTTCGAIMDHQKIDDLPFKSSILMVLNHQMQIESNDHTWYRIKLFSESDICTVYMLLLKTNVNIEKEEDVIKTKNALENLEQQLQKLSISEKFNMCSNLKQDNAFIEKNQWKRVLFYGKKQNSMYDYSSSVII